MWWLLLLLVFAVLPASAQVAPIPPGPLVMILGPDAACPDGGTWTVAFPNVPAILTGFVANDCIKLQYFSQGIGMATRCNGGGPLLRVRTYAAPCERAYLGCKRMFDLNGKLLP